MFRKLIYTFSIFVLINIGLLAEKPATMMWSISDDNSTVYLLGSIHIADSSIYPLNEVIENAFEESENLVLELNVNEIDPIKLFELATLQDGSSLKDYVSEEHYEYFKDKLSKLGLTEAIFSRFKPWMAAVTAMQVEMSDIGMDAKYGIDAHFLRKAYEREMPISNLETIDSQAAAFDSLTIYSDDFIDYSLSEIQMTENEMKVLLKAWSEGEDEIVNQIINETDDIESHNKVLEILLYNRNKKMASKIMDYLKEDRTYFVVVGAAHLIGEKSIFDYLDKTYKYEVKRY